MSSNRSRTVPWCSRRLSQRRLSAANTASGKCRCDDSREAKAGFEETKLSSGTSGYLCSKNNNEGTRRAAQGQELCCPRQESSHEKSNHGSGNRLHRVGSFGCFRSGEDDQGPNDVLHLG